MKHLTFPLLAIAVLAPAALLAAPPPERPEAFEALIRCRALPASADRLACFDSAVASLEAATARREVVVVDRKQIRESKRTLFGLPIPRLALFEGDGEEDEVKSIDGVVASASLDRDSRWLVRLKDGGTWRQIDSRPLYREPANGMKVQINRAAMGSYMMRVENQPGIRVRRET